jgi:D-3-phosphoglycerate dehydrogenase
MAKILINDGIEEVAIKMLKDAGMEVVNEKIAQEDLPSQLQSFDAICVRSATKVRAELIDLCPNLKVIGRGGVGLDNIDVQYAIGKGIKVINTPAASSRSVAELAMGHILNIARNLHDANRQMPINGHDSFATLKKKYSKGIELEGKTMGIIGIGRIGQEMAKIAIGMGMTVIAYDPYISNVELSMKLQNQPLNIRLETIDFEKLIRTSDVISCHTPSVGKAIIGSEEITNMKDGVILINASRGGIIDETALLEGMKSGKIRGAGLDVFLNEPTPKNEILNNENISLTPHIGASTYEAQDKIGIELASQLIAILS